jgi:catechol 2,3-dioxygenase-like lactoylglutathione lyase family enzyme
MNSKIAMAAALALAGFQFAPAAEAQSAAMTGMMGVKIASANFARTTAFYTALGMHSGTRYNDHETSLEWTSPAQGVRLVMVRDNQGSLIKGGAFVVIALLNLDAALARLGAAGFSGFDKPHIQPGFAMLVIKDPDGNQVELVSAAPSTPPGGAASP